MSQRTDAESPGYAIGTVAGLTGLDPHTIRAWERRYGAVEPRRLKGGARRYDDAAVTRLQLLKAVSDCGDPIGSIAHLCDAELRERLGRLAGMAADGVNHAATAPRRVALLAPGLASQLGAEAGALGSLRVEIKVDEIAPFLEKLPDVAPEVVVSELSALGAEPLRHLEAIQDACEPQLILVVYDFAPASELARLSRSGARLVRGPLRLAQLRQVIEDFVAIEATTPRRRPALEPPSGAMAQRIFDDAQLARLIEWQSGVQCECPSHVATLVRSALGFERYSTQCEDRSPQDAALHRYLAASSARIRRELETMLERVCDHEGIRL